MKTTSTRFAALAAAGMLGASAFAAAPAATEKTDRVGRDAAAQPRAAQSGDQAPDGFVLIEEHVIVLTANEPQSHFLRAADYLKLNSPQKAAGEVRIAAAYLDMQASRAKGETSKQELKSAADKLRQAADTVQQQAGGQQQQGDQKAQQQASQITQAFAQANLALAKHFQAMAERAVESKKPVMAGHDLDAAASALQAGVVWAGQKPEQETITAITDAQRLSMQLLAPTGAQPLAAKTNGAGQQQQQGDEAAQPAAARISSKQGQDQGQKQGQGQIPPEASKTIDQLGSAIEKCSQKVGGQSGQSEKAGESKSGQSGPSGQRSGQQSGQSGKQQ